MFQYNNNKFLKFILNYNKISKGIEIFLFNNLPYKNVWEKVYLLDNTKLNFYQKLYETKYFDSHFNDKIIILRKAYIFNCDKDEKKYIDNIDFKFNDNEPKIYLNNYTLILGGDINKNNEIKQINSKLNIINYNNPLTNFTISSGGNKIVDICSFLNQSNNNLLQNKELINQLNDTNNDTYNDINNDTNNDINNDTNNDINNDTNNDTNNDINNDINNDKFNDKDYINNRKDTLNKINHSSFAFYLFNNNLKNNIYTFLIITILTLMYIKIIN